MQLRSWSRRKRLRCQKRPQRLQQLSRTDSHGKMARIGGAHGLLRQGVVLRGRTLFTILRIWLLDRRSRPLWYVCAFPRNNLLPPFASQTSRLEQATFVGTGWRDYLWCLCGLWWRKGCADPHLPANGEGRLPTRNWNCIWEISPDCMHGRHTQLQCTLGCMQLLHDGGMYVPCVRNWFCLLERHSRLLAVLTRWRHMSKMCPYLALIVDAY